MRITFHGAAGGHVTGSMHLLEAAGAQVLLDAGLFQGRRSETHALNATLPFDARRLDAVVVSHGHIDHIGRLPLLTANGFHGPMYATPATRDLMAPMLLDAANLQERDHAYLVKRGRAAPESEPLYTVADAMRVQELTHGVPYRRPHHLRKNMTLEFVDAGHILGSASVDIRISEGPGHRLVFSGDIGRWGLSVIRDPRPPEGPVDTLIIESTYGIRDHEPVDGARARLAGMVKRVSEQGGKLMIPAFALGRTQEVVYALHQLRRAGAIPDIPMYIDSPMAVNVTEVFRMHPEVFDRSEALIRESATPFDFPMLQYIREVSESKRLNTLQGPAIIIAASGMMEGGRILHHLVQHIGDHRSAILIVGYQAENTLGRRIQDGQNPVRIFGDDFTVRAQVESIDGLSAHADRSELRRWVQGVGGPIRRAFVVHGEDEGREGMAQILREEGVPEVILPKLGESFEA